MAIDEQRLRADLKRVDDEFNLVKNQIQQTLLDIREQMLEVSNPFSAGIATPIKIIRMDSVESPQESAAEREEPEPPEAEDRMPEEEPAGAGDESDETSDDDQLVEFIPPEQRRRDPDPSRHPPVATIHNVNEERVPGPSQGVVYEPREPESGAAGTLYELPQDQREGAADAEEEPEPEDVERHMPVTDPEPKPPQMMTPDKREEDASLERQAPPQTRGKLDLITLASLARWVDKASERMGRERVDLLLEIYEISGRLSPTVKDVIKRLCAMAEEDPAGRVPVRDLVAAMVRMDGILEGEDSANTRLLSMILDDENDLLDSLNLRPTG